MRQAAQMASDLGRQLEVPRFSWKYCGSRRSLAVLSECAQDYLRQVKWSLVRFWDKAFLQIRLSGG